ncbi:MAG TPA: SMI1/KNR4 family protein [Verrucomicrobiae bacterium]|jgi:hypothetical protein|nr:SMI1/KNR4 family protein [Verrucomicrobiae bacterium]
MSANRSVQLVLVICFWGFVIAVFVSWKLRDRRRSKASSIERTELVNRLFHPDWQFYERHLQRPAPAALRELYADRRLVAIAGPNHNGKNEISTFMPLDKDSVVDSAGLIEHDVIPIAFSDDGDPIYLRPGAAEPDTVYIAYHDDPGKVLVFADSVAGLLEKLRKEN